MLSVIRSSTRARDSMRDGMNFLRKSRRHCTGRGNAWGIIWRPPLDEDQSFQSAAKPKQALEGPSYDCGFFSHGAHDLTQIIPIPAPNDVLALTADHERVPGVLMSEPSDMRLTETACITLYHAPPDPADNFRRQLDSRRFTYITVSELPAGSQSLLDKGA